MCWQDEHELRTTSPVLKKIGTWYRIEDAFGSVGHVGAPWSIFLQNTHNWYLTATTKRVKYGVLLVSSEYDLRFTFVTVMLLSNPQYKSHLSVQSNCWSFKCSSIIACWRCSNYIFIHISIPGFNGLGKNNCKTRWETFKFGDLVRVILVVWWNISIIL